MGWNGAAGQRIGVEPGPERLVAGGDGFCRRWVSLGFLLECFDLFLISLAASNKSIPVFHVEAGLRSFDRSMPEEINRYTTDHLSDLLFVTEKSGLENLLREKINPTKIHFVGNVMVDTLKKYRDLAQGYSSILETLQLVEHQYAVATLHRPSNVDMVDVLKSILEGMQKLSKE